MRTLVTGATGFFGAALADALLRRGESVRVLVRSPERAAGLADRGAEVIPGRIESAADVRRAAEGVDRIFHIAAVFRTASHPDSYYHDVNVGGTSHVLEAARRHGVAMTVHCGTVGVYGDVREIPCTERTPHNPGDIYQVSKLEGERLAMEAFRAGLPGALVRPATIYGPGDLRLLKLFRSVQRGVFRMFGSGNTLFHGVYIDDLVEGTLLSAETPAGVGEDFILAGPRPITLNELVAIVAGAVGAKRPRRHLPLWPLLAAGAACEALCRPLGLEPPLHRRRVHFFTNNRAFSIEKAHRLLGYEPRVDIVEGVSRTAGWYMREGLLRNAGAMREMPPPRTGTAADHDQRREDREHRAHDRAGAAHAAQGARS